jgi:hypothetical protein
LPDNDQLEEAVREYTAVLRQSQGRHCASWPWSGWTGCGISPASGRSSLARHGHAAVGIYLQLFCDDPKSAEIALINNHVQYEPSTVTGFQGKPVEALSIHALCKPINETVGVHLLVYDPMICAVP